MTKSAYEHTLTNRLNIVKVEIKKLKETSTPDLYKSNLLEKRKTELLEEIYIVRRKNRRYYRV